MTAAYPANMAAHAPCRSLADIALELRRERIALVLAQWEHENAGCDRAAADCVRRIEDIDVRLRAIEAAVSGEDSVFGAGA